MDRSYFDRMKEDNTKHVADPQPGDYWHEMFVPYVVVLAVDGDNLTVCRKRKDVDKDHWTWDLTQTSSMTKQELRELVTYGTIPGFVADVVPQSHMWAVEAFRGADNG